MGDVEDNSEVKRSTYSGEGRNEGINDFDETNKLKDIFYSVVPRVLGEEPVTWLGLRDSINKNAKAFVSLTDLPQDYPARDLYRGPSVEIADDIIGYLKIIEAQAKENLGHLRKVKSVKRQDMRDSYGVVNGALDLWRGIFGPERAYFNPIVLSRLSTWHGEFSERKTERIRPENLRINHIVSYESLKKDFASVPRWGAALAWGMPEFECGSNERLEAAMAYIKSVYVLTPHYMKSIRGLAQNVASTQEFWEGRQGELTLERLTIEPEAVSALQGIIEKNDKVLK
ncbi:MAG: hypothetical protein ACE5FT_02565 [Candidatus Nanoarchaeia archaeon]